MFDIGWSELLVIGIVALIVVGPKDLPGMFRTLGRMMGKMRGLAREFQNSMEAAADEAGVKDIAGDLKNVSSPRKMGLDALEKAMDDATAGLKKWEPGPNTTKMSEERAAQVEKIRKMAADKAQARIDAEALAQSGTATRDDADAVVPDGPDADSPAKPSSEQAS